MNQTQKILLFFILPMLATLLLPPQYFAGSAAALVVVFLVLMGLLGYLLLRGRSAALSLMIFILGFNVIVRLMMFFPRFSDSGGNINVLFTVTSILSIALSTYLLLRLDRVDVRVQMVK
jgi:hypothetical protein